MNKISTIVFTSIAMGVAMGLFYTAFAAPHRAATDVLQQEGVFEQRLAGSLETNAEARLLSRGASAVLNAVRGDGNVTEAEKKALALLSPAERVQLLYQITGWKIVTKTYVSRSQRGAKISKPQLRVPATDAASDIVLAVMEPGVIGITASAGHADAVWDRGRIGATNPNTMRLSGTDRRGWQGNEIFPIWVSPLETARFRTFRESVSAHGQYVMGSDAKDGTWPVRSLAQKTMPGNGCTAWIHRLPLAPRGEKFQWLNALETAVKSHAGLQKTFDLSCGAIDGLNKAAFIGSWRPLGWGGEVSIEDRRPEVFAALREALPEQAKNINLLERWAQKLRVMRTPHFPWAFIGRGTLSELADMRTTTGKNIMDNPGPAMTIRSIKGSSSSRVGAEIRFVKVTAKSLGERYRQRLKRR